MKNDGFMKIASLVLAIATAGVTLASNMLDDKKLDAKVTEAVSEAMKKQIRK